MSYIVDCTPLPLGLYLCGILRGEDVALTLTTEALLDSVAVYFGDEVAREKVDGFDDQGAVFDALRRLVRSLDLPVDLREVALAQLVDRGAANA